MQPREKLLQLGADALTDEELLSVWLVTGTRKLTVRSVAARLLRDFGSVRGLLDAKPGDILASPGIGLARFAQLKAATALMERYLLENVVREDVVTSPDLTRQFLIARLRHREQEVFACLFLDNQHRVLAFEELFFGTIDGASVHPREVLKRTLHHNAAAVILVHNHPSGLSEPSQADARITSRLKSALALLDVRVLDHIIVGEGDPTSLAERGLI